MPLPADPSSGLSGDTAAAASPQGLADRQPLALVAMERMPLPMVITDARQPGHPIVLANAAFLTLSGYGAEEVIGRNCRFLQGPETAPDAVETLGKAIRGGRGITLELLNYRKDGRPFWNQLALSPIRDDQGSVIYFLGSQLDVTERQRVTALEAVERRLLREVNHRAMNVLSIVEGIVRLTRADDPKLYARAVQSRVHSLSRAHAILAGRDWRPVPLVDLLRDQMQPFGEARFAYGGPDIDLRAEMVQPLALVLHELASNAVAHGALAATHGGVDIRWSLDEGRALRLTWRETGLGPTAPAPQPDGFGVTMIRGVIERQLQGEVRRTWTQSGLATMLSLPLGPQRDVA